MELEITIMSGAGNIFSVVDNTKYQFPIQFYEKHATHICENSFSKGRTEGLLVIDKSQKDTDFSLKFFNPDGSFGMMCGNGGRCAVFFASKGGLINRNKSILFDVWDETYVAEFIEDKIKIRFAPPKTVEVDKKIHLEEQIVVGDYVDVNSQHFVIDYKKSPFASQYDFFAFPIKEIAPQIRFHKEFQPKGVNVNFYLASEDKIYLRTYERGVEGETGACGTGAISTAVSLFHRNKAINKFKIIPPSKEEIEVQINVNELGKIDEIYLIGNAKVVEVAKLEIDN